MHGAIASQLGRGGDPETPPVRAIAIAAWLGGPSAVHVDVVEVGGGADDIDAAALEAWLVTRLAETGHANVAASPTAVPVGVEVSADALTLAVGAEHTARFEIDGDGLAQLELVHRALAIVEEIDARAANAAPSSASDTAAAPTLAPTRAPAPTHPLRVRLQAHGGALGRVRAVDPMVSAGVRVAHVRGYGGNLELAVTPTIGSPDVRVIEIVPLLGPSWRWDPARRLGIELGALAGPLVHVWELGRERGVRLDAVGELRGTFDVALTRGLSLVVTPFVGASTHARRHRVGDDTVWRRGLVRFGLALGLGWTWRRRS